MASSGQISYIKSLAEQRDLSTLDVYIMAQINTATFLEVADNKQVDIILTALKALPFKQQAVPVIDPGKTYYEGHPDLVTAAPTKTELQTLEEGVMKGHYFIIDPTDNVEKFFKIDKPEPPSRWSGYTFIKVQASDYFYPIKLAEHRTAILKEIAKDPITAMNEYGIRLGVCGYCGRTLTNRDSRLRGMGPICAGRILNKPTDAQMDTLKRLGLIK